jgi:2-polyprenyl-6-hydroxyphenyl methylase/3-demethylubiquinone-9 3-methyltransferase
MAQAIDNSIYETLGERWYTAQDDPVALLRAEARVKHAWILKRIDGAKTVLDVGCGAGFLTNEFAQKGMTVKGIDMSEDSLRVAKAHDETQSVDYLVGDAYHLPFPDGYFDVVTAMDFLEHVEEPDRVVRECARVLRPGGQFFFHTFNRNPLAWLVIIKFVEWFVKNTPKHMHVLRLFIKPQELAMYCSLSGLQVSEMTGIRPVWGTLSLRDFISGHVPVGMQFTLTNSLSLSYMGVAKKVKAS